jgi:hypothetical protein
MVICDTLKYVYVGIPRTGSKSMNHWLMEHFNGQWHGGHHQADVPEHARDYLVFSLVRNPYDLWVSGHYHVPWDDQGPTQEELGTFDSEAERLRKSRAVLATREKRHRDRPPDLRPLSQRIAEALQDENSNLQSRMAAQSGLRLALYFERLPGCLAELPFVDRSSVPPFPHHPERGIRPPGTFFDLFPREEEQVAWATFAKDFQTFGYRRYETGLPAEAPNALWIS